MKISLEYLLNKKHITLQKFCEINDLSTYESLVVYCSEKNLGPISKELFDKNMPTKEKKFVPKQGKPALASKPEVKTTVKKTPKKRQSSNRRKSTTKS